MIRSTTVPDVLIYGRLIALDREIKGGGVMNKNDRVTALIAACIDEGIDAGSLIVSVLVKLQFNKQHVGSMLNREANSAKATRLWYRDTEGRYHNQEASAAA